MSGQLNGLTVQKSNRAPHALESRELVENRFSFFPIVSSGDASVPRYAWGHLEAGQSILIPPGDLIGSPTGIRNRDVIIDLDVKHDGYRNFAAFLGVPSASQLPNDKRALPAICAALGVSSIRIVITRSGGAHLYFAHPGAHVRLQNSAGKLAPGVDVRGDGGYVKIPPSPGYTLLCDADPLPPAPEWLVSFATAPERSLRDPSAPIGIPTERSILAAESTLANRVGELSRATSGGNDLMARAAFDVGGWLWTLPGGFERAAHELEQTIAHWTDRERHLDTMRRSLSGGAESPWPEPDLDPILDQNGSATESQMQSSLDFYFIESAELSKDDGPISWICEGLRLTPGAPSVFAGYGYSGKTAAVQSLAVSIASGLPVWGLHHVERPGKVIHLDYEQGARLTKRRYQRLACGLGVDLSQLPIKVAPLPRFRLSDPRSIDLLRRHCEGASLVIVDSLKASSDWDENSSDARRVHDALLLLSEYTGAHCNVIDHARKQTQGAEEDDARYAMRGTGAKYDAISEYYNFSGGQKGLPIRVQHRKERLEGRELEDFGLVIEDVSTDGLVVRAITKDELRLRVQSSKIDQASTIDHTVIAVISAHPGCGVREIRAGVRAIQPADNTVVDGAIERLVRELRVYTLRQGPGKKIQHYTGEIRP